MNLYAVGGLGADQRVFTYIDDDIPLISVQYITPYRNESLKDYTYRLLDQIDTSQPFGLLGVSFGGLVVLELASMLTSEFIILVSSVLTDNQLPAIRKIGHLGVLNIVPTALLKPPPFILNRLCSAENNQLLSDIIGDTDPSFIRWALNRIVRWRYSLQPNNVIRIHGNKDRLIPLKGEAHIIDGGGHFMIVDRASEISQLIRRIILPYQ